MKSNEAKIKGCSNSNINEKNTQENGQRLFDKHGNHNTDSDKS